MSHSRLASAVSDPWRATLGLVGLTSLLRLATAGSVELTVDEAHYALYAYHLDWSYFDHPPMAGWLQALVLPFSQSDLALRLMPIALFAASSLVLYRLARECFPECGPWLGFYSVALLQSALMLQLIGLAMVPDDPLLCFGLASLLYLRRALEGGRTADWLLVGLTFGLAGLSKYTALVLVIAALLAVVLGHHWRRLRAPGPWLAVLLAALLVLPVVVWNARHEWISFAYQLHHGTKGAHWSPQDFALSQAGQLLAYGPALYGFGLVAALAGLRRLEHPGMRYTVLPGLTTVLLFAWNSGYYLTLPHWTALGMASMAPLAARWLMAHWHRRTVRWIVWPSGAYSLVVILAVFFQLLHPWLPFSPNRHPLAQLYGWKQAAHRAQALREAMAGKPGAAPVLFVANWTLASRLAWYARPTPVQVLGNRVDQFTLWYGKPAAGARGIVVVPGYLEGRRQGATAWGFARCREAAALPILVQRRPASTFRFFACEGYHQPAKGARGQR